MMLRMLPEVVVDGRAVVGDVGFLHFQVVEHSPDQNRRQTAPAKIRSDLGESEDPSIVHISIVEGAGGLHTESELVVAQLLILDDSDPVALVVQENLHCAEPLRGFAISADQSNCVTAERKSYLDPVRSRRD